MPMPKSEGQKLYDGPLIQHSDPNTARLAAVLEAAAQELWEIAALDDRPRMWDEARDVASHILAYCDHPQREDKL